MSQSTQLMGCCAAVGLVAVAQRREDLLLGGLMSFQSTSKGARLHSPTSEQALYSAAVTSFRSMQKGDSVTW